MASSGAAGHCQEAPPPAKVPEVVAASNTVTVMGANAAPLPLVPPKPWETDETLQGKVSFEVLRRPLREVLEQVRQQSGVTLAIDAAVPAANWQITARVKEMTVAEWMSSLRRLYAISWRKEQEKHWSMVGGHLTPLQRGLLLRGWGGFDYSAKQNWSAEADAAIEERQDVALQVLEFADSAPATAKAVRSPEGIEVAALPLELQNKLKVLWDDHLMGELLNFYLRSGHLRAKTLPVLPEAPVQLQARSVPADRGAEYLELSMRLKARIGSYGYLDAMRGPRIKAPTPMLDYKGDPIPEP